MVGNEVETLAELLLAAALRCPHGSAFEDPNRVVTWEDASRRSAGIAAYLGGIGVGRGDRVVVHRHKDVTSYEVVHAILRAGAVVVPVDPRATAAVALGVIADADPALVIVDSITEARLTGRLDRPLLCASGPSEASSDAELTWEAIAATAAAASPVVGPDDPAYIIYTSGSTGTPKGIVHTHRSAMAYARITADLYGLGPEDRVAGMNPFHFDMSTLELYVAPLCGATTVVMSETDMQFPAAFTQRAASTRTTVWYGVPFFLRQLVSRGAVAERELSCLRWLLYGGEPFPSAAVAELMTALPSAKVSNVYGPAEVNQCTYFDVETPPTAEIPLGRPTPGVQLVVLDDHAQPVGPGEQGELWVCSPTMSDGYWMRPELNAERFRTDGKGQRWYGTGDLVSTGSDGLLRYHGRRDHQVKLRGIRIELEAVENVLTDAPGVLHAVAGPLVDDHGQTTGDLVAALVLLPEFDLDEKALRRFARTRLPAVAVPVRFDVMARFPETGSGKIDRRIVRAALNGAGSTRTSTEQTKATTR